MGRCVIFCAGQMDRLLEPPEPEDYIIAADGGLAHVQGLGLTPHCILGDFDSLGYVPEESQVYPVEKDDTDAMLAARRGLALGYRSFLFYGGMDGPRLDHTLANFQTLQYVSDRGATGYLIGQRYIATVVQNERICFAATAKGILSVFCLGADARGVTLKGLQYPLEKGTLTAGFPLGVSNHFIGEPATVAVETGSLLVLYDRQNGFPTEREQEARICRP
ncbi:MAG: thiamine diphosphokinase [Ruminococcaceae bacterium]|nr:thiamine diphosphokinase [Oscillospiraceae bacterium]